MIKKLFLVFFVFLLSSILIQAQSIAAELKQVRVVEIEHVFSEEFFGTKSSGLLDAGGVGFPPGANTLLNLNDPKVGEVSLALVVPPESKEGRITLIPLEIDDPINIAFDSLSVGASGFDLFRLFLVDTRRGQLTAVRAGARGGLVREGIEHSSLKDYKVADPQGATLDPGNGALYILDAEGPSIVRLTPRLGRDFADALVSLINLPRGLGTLRGLAFNPEDNHLYAMNPERNTLHKLTLDGDVVAVFELPVAGVLQGMIFAPSLDLTDYPGVYHLYLATELARSKNSGGKVTEWAIPGSLSPRANFSGE